VEGERKEEGEKRQRDGKEGSVRGGGIFLQVGERDGEERERAGIDA
jgi:hypothetical protein